MREHLRAVVSSFVAKHSNKSALITITSVTLSPDLKSATFLISVFPRESEDTALHFLRRKRSECHEYLKQALVMKTIPHVDFALDQGEKHRQHIEELLRAKRVVSD